MDPLCRILPDQVLAVGCAYLTNLEFRRECLVLLRNQLVALADQLESPASCQFSIVSYSFGTIMISDLLTQFRRRPLGLATECK